VNKVGGIKLKILYHQPQKKLVIKFQELGIGLKKKVLDGSLKT
jgi:hypothetical protein